MKNLLSVWLAALLCLVGCTNEDIANATIKKGTIQATLENGASRLAIGENNTLTWTKGDAFKMFNSMNEGAVWTLQGNGGTEMGIFEGTELEGSLAGAAFPASASPNYQWGTLTMTLPAALDYKEGICNLPMWAKFSSLDDDVSFNHLAALLKIDFKDIPEGYNSLTVRASKAIAGTFSAKVNNAEPVLALKENGSNSVTVTFDEIEGTDNDRLFYLPLPVGDYASINVSISDGENTLSIADWRDRTIVRKKVYLASLTYRVSDANTPGDVSSELKSMAAFTPTPSVEIAEEIHAEDGNIVIPSDAKNVSLDFQKVPSTSAAPLTFVEEAGTSKATLVVSLPDASANANVKFDMPNTTVQVTGGNYATIAARTAANTLVIAEGTTVENLVIYGGNVSIRGGKVTGSINRDASNTDAVTYVYVDEADDLEDVTLGTGVQMVFADYVTLTADAEQTFRLSKEVQTMEYSVGGGKWTELGSSTVAFGGDKGTLRLRGKNGLGTSVSAYYDDRSSVVFGDLTVPVAASGNILTLADYENYSSEGFDTSNVRFSNLFMNCSNLTSVPELPATVLADNCYLAMFSGCTALTKAPVLPATTLATGCYGNMFSGCTGLTEAPVLPATTLADNCYQYMFSGCTGLTEAPVLPNTILADYCYSGMFSGCTGLTKAPELPVTTLADFCYANMFSGCTGLTEAPVLPATTLANYCYQSMFSGCTALTETPELPATTLANNCYESMFYGCTALTKAHDLSAITLADNCCSMMFYDCTALTEAPALPATTLTVGCYQNMFRGCSSLTVAPELPATTLADYCYRYMLQDCNLSEAPELPATTLANWCYSGMFINNKNLTKSPVLSAPTLTNRSYTWMFEGCSALTEVTMLATDVSASECLGGWLNGVPATGTFYKNAALTDVSALGIPEGWTVEDYGTASAGIHQIRYTSTDGNIVTPNSWAQFGANIVSNTYENGVGIIEFDGPVTTLSGLDGFSGAFGNCTTLKSIEIPNTVTSVGYGTFFWCTALQNVTLPKNITKIEDFTFHCCESLEPVVIPEGVTVIGVKAFGGNIKKASVTFPESLVEISTFAFEYNEALTTVTIPGKVTSIGESAFRGCKLLTSMHFKPVTPPAGNLGIYSEITIYVPASSVDAYKEAWPDYADWIVAE